MFCFPQDMVFGSNELIYVAGSPLPIMMEEVDEEEEEELEEGVEKRRLVVSSSEGGLGEPEGRWECGLSRTFHQTLNPGNITASSTVWTRN